MFSGFILDLSRVYDFKFLIFVRPNFWKYAVFDPFCIANPSLLICAEKRRRKGRDRDGGGGVGASENPSSSSPILGFLRKVLKNSYLLLKLCDQLSPLILTLLLKISDQLHYVDSRLLRPQGLSSASPIWFLVVPEALWSQMSPHKSQKTLQKLSATTKP